MLLFFDITKEELFLYDGREDILLLLMNGLYLLLLFKLLLVLVNCIYYILFYWRYCFALIFLSFMVCKVSITLNCY